MAEALRKVFGIDLGTTYSCISYVDEYAKPITVQNAESERITPSVVFFDGDKVIVGTVAKGYAKIHPTDVVEMVKRHMGDPDYLFEHNGKTYRAEEISSFILRKVVCDAEKALNERIVDVVITCPAYFGANQREATVNAGKIAGLNVLRIINEPTAAALAYGLETGRDEVVLVYDLGGGTFDITMIAVKDNQIQVVCTGGDHNLGGKDWDTAIVDYLASEFQEQNGIQVDIRGDAETLQELYSSAEKTKKTLSQREKDTIRVIHSTGSCRVELTRSKFEELTNSFLKNTIGLTEQMLAEARSLGHERFDKILLVGGSTRMPQVSRRLKELFTVPIEMFDPDEAVTRGAAIYGWKLALDAEIKVDLAEQTGRRPEQIDLTAFNPLTVETAREKVADEHELGPLARKIGQAKLIDVTSKTFGVVVTDPVSRRESVENLICRNAPVPAQVTRNFGILDDNQASVDVRLMENLALDPRATFEESTLIGRAELPLPPGLRALRRSR